MAVVTSAIKPYTFWNSLTVEKSGYVIDATLTAAPILSVVSLYQ